MYRVRDSGSEGPSHARRAYGDLDRPRLVVKPRNWVSKESKFVSAPSKSMWVSRPSLGSGRTDRQAGVGLVTAQ